MARLTEAEQAAIREAMRRANPDTPGDLMRHLWQLCPRAAALVAALSQEEGK